jgi:hypothetical protein
MRRRSEGCLGNIQYDNYETTSVFLRSISAVQRLFAQVGPILEPYWTIWTHVGAILGNLGAIFKDVGLSWSILSQVVEGWGHAGLLWSYLGPSWDLSRGHLTPILGPSWAILGPCWAHFYFFEAVHIRNLRIVWATNVNYQKTAFVNGKTRFSRLEPCWAIVGLYWACLGFCWAHFGFSWAILGDLGIILGQRGAILD